MMTAAIVLSVIAAAGTILSIVFLPEVKIKGKRIPVFFVVPVISAILIVALNVLTFREALDGLTGDMASMFHGRNSVNPVKILLLFFGMTTVSVFLDEAGVFKFLATKSMKLAGHSRTKLFFILYGVVSILTVFTSNDIIILTFTPYLLLLQKRRHRSRAVSCDGICCGKHVFNVFHNRQSDEHIPCGIISYDLFRLSENNGVADDIRRALRPSRAVLIVQKTV